MGAIELLNKYIIPAESTLEAVTVTDLHTVLIRLSVYELNFTAAFFDEWKVPTDQRAAREAIKALFGDDQLMLELGNVAYLCMDRIRGTGTPRTLMGPGPSRLPPGALRERKVVYGFGFDGPLLLEQFPEFADAFHCLEIDVVDARITSVFQELLLPNFPIL